MVRGIEIFKEKFRDYKGQYVFIGGAACDIILGREGISFRNTKDLDIVLLAEVLNEKFVDQFIHFIEMGGYQHIDKGTGEDQFYRFTSPTDKDFPFMIELFSRKPDYLKTLDTRLAPIHVSDDVVSLSAILLDEDYYNMIKSGIVVVDGISVLDLEYIVLFKIKAWLDLSYRKENNEKVDSKNIKKHKNDIFRLMAVIEPTTRLTVEGQILNDVVTFLEKNSQEKFDLKTLGIKGITYSDILERIKSCYGVM